MIDLSTHQPRLDLPMCRQLADLVGERALAEGINDTAIPGLQIYRTDHPTSVNSAVYEPALCVIAQGSKTVQLGDKEIMYGPLSYMISAGRTPRGRLRGRRDPKSALSGRQAIARPAGSG